MNQLERINAATNAIIRASQALVDVSDLDRHLGAPKEMASAAGEVVARLGGMANGLECLLATMVGDIWHEFPPELQAVCAKSIGDGRVKPEPKEEVLYGYLADAEWASGRGFRGGGKYHLKGAAGRGSICGTAEVLNDEAYRQWMVTGDARQCKTCEGKRVNREKP